MSELSKSSMTLLHHAGPRFSEAETNCLKRVMLSRTTDFTFLAEDVLEIEKETGLRDTQILKWSCNFRERYPELEMRMKFLKPDSKLRVS